MFAYVILRGKTIPSSLALSKIMQQDSLLFFFQIKSLANVASDYLSYPSGIQVLWGERLSQHCIGVLFIKNGCCSTYLPFLSVTDPLLRLRSQLPEVITWWNEELLSVIMLVN